jgi:hypothetical protein
MKFMKRKSDAEADAKEEAEKRRKLLDSQWTADNDMTVANGDRLICTRDDSDLLSALPGRRSFGGFNKPIERHYEQIMDERRFEKALEKSKKNAVSDEEMVARYETLIGLPRGPNQGQRQQQPQGHHNKPSRQNNGTNTQKSR